MKKFTSEKQKIGEIGEKIAYMFLVKHGFCIIETNFTRKCGELDIVAIKDKHLHFIEVKTVSCVTKESLYLGTIKTIRPEEQFHYKKIEKMHRTIVVYLEEKKISRETVWSIDLLCVYLFKKQGRVVPFWNVVV